MKSYTAQIEEDENGDAIVPLPEEMLEELGWKEGDELSWTDNKDGSYTLTKQLKTDEKVWVLVETIQTFRHRYVVEAPKDHPEYALDTVVMENAKEFSQKHLGEEIFSHRVISQEDALELFDIDNDYCKSWEESKKIENFFTREGEKIKW